MLYRLKYLCVIMMIIGMIGIAINTIFGYGTVDLFVRYRVGTIWLWKFNVKAYISNIELSFQDVSRLTLELPERQWMSLTDGFWEGLSNNLALMLDYIILIGNVIMYPIRIGAYAVREVLAIIGINVVNPNTESGIFWLVKLTNYMQEYMQIPYI